MKGWVKFQVQKRLLFRLERELFEYRYKDIDSVTIQCTEEVKGVFCGEQHVHLKRLEEILGFSISFNVVEHEKPFYQIVQLH